MELFYRKYGEGPAIIIVHGLYGASDNWVTVAKALADNFEVYLLDQRNHGRSPHDADHTYDVMKDDLLEFMERHELNEATIIGHSMGGKTAMFFAKNYPEKVTNLMVIDIAPKSYALIAKENRKTIDHERIIDALLAVDFSTITTREEVEAILESKLPTERVRKFLMKNLRRNKDNTFSWSVNLKALKNNLPLILDGLNEKDFDKGRGITGFPVIFVKGANSDYITRDDFDVLIQTIFPFAELVTIPNAGHWVHAEQPKLLIKNIKYFLEV
jgi:esterase